MIRVFAKTISVVARTGRGVKIMKMADDSKVVAVARATHEEDTNDNEITDENTEIQSQNTTE